MAKPIPVVGALCSVPMHCRQLHVPGTIEDRRRIDWLGKSRVATELYGDMSDRVQLDSKVRFHLSPSRWWTVRRFGGDPFLTPQSSQHQPARPLTPLDILLHRSGYSVWRLGSASFTGSTPEAATVNELFSTTYAGFVWRFSQFIHLTASRGSSMRVMTFPQKSQR